MHMQKLSSLVNANFRYTYIYDLMEVYNYVLRTIGYGYSGKDVICVHP